MALTPRARAPSNSGAEQPEVRPERGMQARVPSRTLACQVEDRPRFGNRGVRSAAILEPFAGCLFDDGFPPGSLWLAPFSATWRRQRRHSVGLVLTVLAVPVV